MTRSYNVIGGIIDTLLGIFSLFVSRGFYCYSPTCIGCWLLYHSFMLMGLGMIYRLSCQGLGLADFCRFIIVSPVYHDFNQPPKNRCTVVVLLTGSAFIIAGIIPALLHFVSYRTSFL